MLNFEVHFKRISNGIIFCQVSRIVRRIHPIFLLNFIIHVLKGNIPILIKIESITKKNVTWLLCSQDQFRLKILAIRSTDGRD